jgi:thioredoxin-dependent peroxiredoxin
MKQAPPFTLPDQYGQNHSLADYAGTWLVLYFYPEDESPDCTAEACAFRDGRKDLQAAGAEVVGVSNDSVASHKEFAKHHELNFTLLSDDNGTIAKAYDAWGTRRSGKIGTLRKTFLISPEGKIAKSYPEVSPSVHTPEVLADLEALRA